MFREDLYFRLNVVEIKLPPLNERGGDILILAKKFIEKYSRKIGKEISGLDAGAAEMLTSYGWPGNVRELENVIERAIILTQSGQISASDLSGLSQSGHEQTDSSIVTTMAEIEKKYIKKCLELNDWNIGKSAEQLGIHRNTLSSKIKEYNLSQD